MSLDRVSLEILSNKACAISEEMGLTLQRAGRTIYVKETADFATGLVTRDGEFFGYPQRIGVVGFVGLNSGKTIRSIKEFEPGDIVITNDPYHSGGLSTHLPDLSLIKPYFVGGRLVCFGWCFIHSADIGGKVPSSISPSNTEIYQEGLRLPPVKLYAGGKLDEDMLAVYRANCRTPDLNWGDIQAMIACLGVGEKRVAELAEEHGPEALIAAQEEVLDYSRRVSREALRKIPNGTYRFTDYLDDDLVSMVPVRINVSMTVDDGEVHVDFTGTDIATVGPLNIATGGSAHPWLVLRLVAMARSYAADLHYNAGIIRNLTVTAPKRSVVNPEPPASVGVRSATGLRVCDALNGALATACPELVTASPAGSAVPIVFVEPDPEGGDTKVNVIQFVIGGTGGRDGADGIDGRDPGLSSMANNPIEIVENESSVRILEYGIRPDSGGPGRHRGGCGQRFVFRAEADNGTVLARAIERARFQPWGLAGGGAGAAFEIYRIRPSGERRRLGKIDTLEVERGDVIEVLSPGGGGYGDPFARPADEVLNDVLSGRVSEACAAGQYGVVIADGRLDAAATEACRAAPPDRSDAFRFGPLRPLWEATLPPEAQASLIAAWIREPMARRNAQRRRFFARLDTRLLDREQPDLAALLAGLDENDVRAALAAAIDPPHAG